MGSCRLPAGYEPAAFEGNLTPEASSEPPQALDTELQAFSRCSPSSRASGWPLGGSLGPGPMQATYPNGLAGSRLWLLSLRIFSLWSSVHPSSKDHCPLYCLPEAPKQWQRMTRVRAKWLLCLEASLKSFSFGKAVELQQMSQLFRRRPSPLRPASRNGVPRTTTQNAPRHKAVVPTNGFNISPVCILLPGLSSLLSSVTPFPVSSRLPWRQHIWIVLVKYFVDRLLFVSCFLTTNE